MNRTASLVLGLALISSAAMATPTPDPAGNWERADGATRIKIAPCGQNLCAVNTWVKDPHGDEAVGDRLVMTLTPKSADALEGKAFDEKRKTNYALTLTIKGNSMSTHGCIIDGIVCKELDWNRIR